MRDPHYVAMQLEKVEEVRQFLLFFFSQIGRKERHRTVILTFVEVVLLILSFIKMIS